MLHCLVINDDGWTGRQFFNQSISPHNEYNSLFGSSVGVCEFPKIVEFEGKIFQGIASFIVSE